MPPKRLSGDAPSPPPATDSLIPNFNSSLRIAPPRRHRSGALPAGKVNYGPGPTSLWWPVGAPDGADLVPTLFRLEPVPGGSHLVPARGKYRGEGGSRGGSGGGELRPWEAIVDKLEAPLFACVQRAAEVAEAEGEEVKLAFLARIGKVRFKGGAPIDYIRKAAAASTNWKSFCTDVSNAYMEHIQQKIVPQTELSFESAKEHYLVKLYDKSRLDSTISCKCMVGDDGKLNIHKIELNSVRHLVVDLSCLYKDLDFRLMLANKRRLTSPGDEEKSAIDKLIKSAILDPAVKGGLRWPLGKYSVDGRFNVVGVWHTEYKAFRGSAMRLKLRHADRFDHRTSTGEISNEVTMKLPGISKKLRDGDLERETVLEMIEDAVKLIWDHFLNCNS